MRILVFEPDTPITAKAEHNCSRANAKLACAMKLARQVGQNAIQLIDLAWREVKQRLKGNYETPAKFPTIYEHHIEPKLEILTIADSAWLRYLHGISGWQMVTA